VIAFGLVVFGGLLAGFVRWKLRSPVKKSAGWNENSVAAIRERVERERAEAVPRDVWPRAADLRKATRLPSSVELAPFVPAQRVALSLATPSVTPISSGCR
jgi:hypothetical protein